MYTYSELHLSGGHVVSGGIDACVHLTGLVMVVMTQWRYSVLSIIVLQLKFHQVQVMVMLFTSSKFTVVPLVEKAVNE